jgi:hypothetical protein
MSATQILAPVLQFPVQHSCPTCNRACAEDELSECMRCGQQYCRFDSWDCECDRTAREMKQRAEESK